MQLLNQHRQVTIIGAVIAIAGVIVFNISYYGNQLSPPTADPSTVVPLVNPATGQTLDAPSSLASSPTSAVPLAALIVTLGVVLIGGLATWMVMKRLISQKRQRDQCRQTDLISLAQTFEAYRLQVGTYPISLTTPAAYYTGVILMRDWRYLRFPADEEMRRYLASWPLSDPTIPVDQPDQTNAYLYVPHDNGQRFDLYAHLEAPDKDAPDYNFKDTLPRAWGSYTFKISCRAAADPLQHSTPKREPLPTTTTA